MNAHILGYYYRRGWSTELTPWHVCCGILIAFEEISLIETETAMAEVKDYPDFDSAADAIQNAATTGRRVLEEGLDQAREYGEKSFDYVSSLRGQLEGFVKRDPLLAVGAAFLVGYVAAQIFKRAH
jgi:hypothetical protein